MRLMGRPVSNGRDGGSRASAGQQEPGVSGEGRQEPEVRVSAHGLSPCRDPCLFIVGYVMQVLREQRLENRLGKSIPLQIRFEDSNIFSGETVNVSSRGLSCRVPCYVPPFSRLSIDMDMPLPSRGLETLQMDALVVRTEKCPDNARQGDHVLGLFFLKLDQEKAILMNEFLDGLDGADKDAMIPVNNKNKLPKKTCLGSEFNPQGFLQDFKLTRLDRLTCLGELSSVLAHEIKNPLACLAGSLQVLGEEIKGLYPSEDLFSELFSQIDRIDSVVDHLLQFSTTEAPQRTLVRVEDVIDNTLQLLGGKLKEKNIQVDLCHGDDQPLISADKRMLQQAFLNVVDNIVGSMERNGRFSINTHWTDKAPVCNRASCECFTRESNNGISVVMMDSKFIGKSKKESMMPLSLADRKKHGLNLSLTQQIIEQHNGNVFVPAPSEKSSVLLVTLPL